MVVNKPCVSEAENPLPQLTLDSMSQRELKELIPVLVTKVTGRPSPFFGSLRYRPEWWPCDLEWTDPEDLADKYQDPCEKLRKVVRSCYCYMDQDNLLGTSDLPEYPSDLPQSPAKEEKDIYTEKVQNKTGSMTVQSEVTSKLPAAGAAGNTSGRNTPDVNKQSGNDSMLPSCEEGLGTSCGQDKITGGEKTSMVVDDCEITGMSISTSAGGAEDISAEVIAQIDYEIAKSLKAAFENLNNLGTSSAAGQKKKNRKTGLGGQLGFGSLFGLSGGPNQVTQPTPSFQERSADKEQKKLTQLTPSFQEPSADKEQKQLTQLTSTFQECSADTEQNSEMTLPEIKIEPRDLKDTVNKVTNKKAAPDNSALVDKECSTSSQSRTVSPAKEEKPGIKQEKCEDEVVWICFICAKGFADQTELMKHQEVCENEVDLPDIAATHQTGSGDKSSASLSTVNSVQPVPAVLRKVGSNIKSLPLGLPSRPSISKRRPKPPPDIYIPPSRDIYFESLGLFPTPRVQAIAKSPRKTITDDDCQVIDLTVDEAQQAAPVTPRTKSMLSQLSREDSHGRIRNLSFSQYISSPRKEKPTEEESDSSEDEYNQRQRVPSKAAILGIPLTSPLGQRLKKHWNYETKVPIIEDIEKYCRTNQKELEKTEKEEKKNAMVEKLRNRPPPQCTFRFTKKHLNKWFHAYKFNRADRREFFKTLKAGLDRESRLKLKKLKPCKVVLSRLSNKDIKFWTTPRPKATKPAVSQRPVPYRQSVFSNIQFNTATALQARTLPSSNFQASSMLQGMALQSIRNAGPTPQLLVRTVPMGGQGMRLQVLPIQNHMQNVFVASAPPVPAVAQPPPSGSQKRKQQFTNVREDDNMVICIDSDEEEEIVVKPQLDKKTSCAMCIIYKEYCKIHGKKRMGPASFQKANKSPKMTPLSSAPLILKTSSSVVSFAESRPATAGHSVSQNSNSASKKVFKDNIQSTSNSSKSLSFTDLSKVTGSQIADLKASIKDSKPVKHSSQTVSQVKTETDSGTQKQNQSADNSEYMDFEVICIDSDDED